MSHFSFQWVMTSKATKWREKTTAMTLVVCSLVKITNSWEQPSASILSLPWRGKQHVPIKYQSLSTILCDVTSQKTIIFIFTTSNSIYLIAERKQWINSSARWNIFLTRICGLPQIQPWNDSSLWQLVQNQCSSNFHFILQYVVCF